MKIKSLLLAGLAALLCAAVMTACSNSVDESEDAVLEIDLSKFENRDQIKDKNIAYEIDIIDDGGTIVENLKRKKGDKIQVRLSIGVYDISVTAFLDGEEFAKGIEKDQTVIQGPNRVTVQLILVDAVPLQIVPSGGTHNVTADPFKITLTSDIGVLIEYQLTGAQDSSGAFSGSGQINISNIGISTLNAIARGNGLLEDSQLEYVYTLNTTWTPSANNTSNTTAIVFKFVLPVSSLTLANISITNVTGAFASNGTQPTTSDGGKTWTLNGTTSKDGSIQVNVINKDYVVSGVQTMRVYRVFPLWTAIPAGTANGTTTTFGTSNIMYVAWGGNMFIAVSGRGTMTQSADGVICTRFNGSSVGKWSVAWGGNKFVSGSDNGRIGYWQP